MALEPTKAFPAYFEISDANADIDAVLTAIEGRVLGLHGIHSLEGVSPEAEAQRLVEIAALEQATEEILQGAISKQSVQWIRSVLEDKVGEAEAERWFPEAGEYTAPRTFGEVLLERERAVELAESAKASLPANPEVQEVRDILGPRIAGVVIRSYDEMIDRLPEEDRRQLHSFLERRGMRIEPISREIDLGGLCRTDERYGGGSDEPGVTNRPIAETVRALLDAGVQEMYHATGLFTYEGLKGSWVLDTHRIGRNSGQFGGFFMADRLDWDDGSNGLANYLQSDRFHDMCRRGAVPLSEIADQIGDRGVLLKIDLRGYLEFLHAETSSGLHTAASVDGRVLRAVCPPPADFVRPVAVFEYP
ncbi:MAG: hypothetical protein RL417_1772 [Pseudomonadota bacterium]|jgi:hypothetical protein